MGMLDGLSPQFAGPLGKMMEDAKAQGVTLNPLSGYRSPEDQQRAIRQVAQRNNIPFHAGLYQTGIPGMAAPVGRSQHQHGAALDWDVSDPKVKSWLYANAGNYGFRFPLPNSDSGHMEFGSQHGTTQSGSVPATYPQQSAGAPMPRQQPTGLGGLIAGLEQTMGSPLFQTGLGMVNAGAQGINPAGGLLAGQQGQRQAKGEEMKNAQHQMVLDQANAGREYLNNLNPNDPQFKGLPPAILSMAKGMQDPSLISKAYAQKMDLDQQERVARMTGNVQLEMHIKQKKADLEAELENRKQTLQLLQNMRPGAQGQAPAPRRYNPATGELE